MLHFTLFTLYPELFPGALGAGIIERARKQGLWSYKAVALRDYANNAYGSIDERPAGGGPGMVMRCDCLAAALDENWFEQQGDAPVYVLSPAGEKFDQPMARKWTASEQIALLCGRFEAIDQRLFEARPLIEVSLGDFVLAGGEVAAQAMMEASIRLLPGATGNRQSVEEESFEQDLLEAPHYTQPRLWEKYEIPTLLLSGDHQKVARWREEQARIRTRKRRPDLWERYQKGQKD